MRPPSPDVSDRALADPSRRAMIRQFARLCRSRSVSGPRPFSPASPTVLEHLGHRHEFGVVLNKPGAGRNL